MRFLIILFLFISAVGSNKPQENESFDIDTQLNYCVNQASKTLASIPQDKEGIIPRNVSNGTIEWTFVEYEDWTSGFWPGILWYLYEYTGEEKWQKEAHKYTSYLEPLSVRKATDHDLGFQVYCSAGNGYRLTNDSKYKEMILKTADTLATLYNPLVGTIHSWPSKPQYPHNTIVDNMMNLELLYWACKNEGSDSLCYLATDHAETTMENHFRENYSAYHLISYDTISGKKIRGVAHQGYADESMWARGQAWAIYGYTMVYRETGDKKFLDFAHKVASIYLQRLPEDLIPFWDFDVPDIPNVPKDASAAAVVASALLELHEYTEKPDLAEEYLNKAVDMLRELSDNYQSKNENTSFLLHSTGHHPKGSEIDASIIYADYYYIEALLRLKKMKGGI